jgi:hypothetical protein
MNDALSKAAARGANTLQITPPQLGGGKGTTSTATETVPSPSNARRRRLLRQRQRPPHTRRRGAVTPSPPQKRWVERSARQRRRAHPHASRRPLPSFELHPSARRATGWHQRCCALQQGGQLRPARVGRPLETDVPHSGELFLEKALRVIEQCAERKAHPDTILEWLDEGELVAEPVAEVPPKGPHLLQRLRDCVPYRGSRPFGQLLNFGREALEQLLGPSLPCRPTLPLHCLASRLRRQRKRAA